MCEKPFTRADLEQLIKELLGITEVPFQIKRQIREYCTERGFTYKGIARALVYLIEQKKWDFCANYSIYGIGLVKKDNIYGEAQTYFTKLRIAKEKELQRQQEIINEMQTISANIIQCGRADTNKKKKTHQIDISSL